MDGQTDRQIETYIHIDRQTQTESVGRRKKESSVAV